MKRYGIIAAVILVILLVITVGYWRLMVSEDIDFSQATVITLDELKQAPSYDMMREDMEAIIEAIEASEEEAGE